MHKWGIFKYSTEFWCYMKSNQYYLIKKGNNSLQNISLHEIFLNFTRYMRINKLKGIK